ncbi:serine/arginine repetitive matrix protein 2 [Streptomyces sp. NRRL F-5650]|uniref:serine/arginine repetitive matrix protein 2 n=1 Tax=Streptomyces sp. NRRL F-5650 TaxID=1463868 RepID=UPI0004C7A7D4|nr:serine/arginine repetitive matrix protein 2 [Streptomyces sp. NRRL F-5650]
MPIITAPVTTPPTGPPTGGGTPVPLPEIGLATATYTDPSGTVWPLTDELAGWFTLSAGVSGLGAVEYEYTSDAQPRGGERLRHAQPQPRAIVWPLYVYSDTSHMEFIERWRALATAFTRTLRPGPDGRRPPGVLEITRPDGSRRRINVHYRSGFEGRGTQGSGILSDTAVITLWAEDPFWVDADTISVHREQGVGRDFLRPYPSVSSSQVLGATTVTNPGDETVWPTWTITGPASLVTFMRQDTGDSFTLDPSEVGHGPLLAGQQVTVRTEPVQVRYQDGANWLGALNWPDAVLWGLDPGVNNVTFALTGAGAGSAVDLQFSPRYQTA